MHRRAARVASGVDLPPGLRIVESPALPGSARSAFVARLNARLMLRTLRREAPADHAPWDLIIFNDPRAARVAAALPTRRRVFDCMDDLAAMLPSAAFAQAAEAQSLAVADRVWTGTFSLAERLQGRHASVRFIPCGVDAAHFGAAAAPPRPIRPSPPNSPPAASPSPVTSA